MPDFSSPSDEALAKALKLALADAGAPAAKLAVAYSGGLDSSVLLTVAASLGVELVALHVHHGISAQADDWLAHCQARCAQLGVAFCAERVALAGVADSGIEEAARLARYAALGRMCRAQGASMLVSAHHLDDQAETVLLQLLRGSGLPGMSGMQSCDTAPSLLGDDTTRLLRPWLGVTRAQLEAFAARHGVVHVEDDSNADVRYARNALRHQVMPALGAAFPGYQQRLARAAGHAQGAQALLRELAEQDLLLCLRDDYLLMPALRALSEQRFFNLMRHWFARRGMRMPSAAWMDEMRAQLLQAGEEAQLCVSHPDGELHRYRERVFLAPRRTAPDPGDVFALRWEGQALLRVPAYYGALHVDVVGADDARAGFDAAWLRGQRLSVHGRQGGERVKLAANRPARSLKQHYQSADIPAWQRPFLPMVWAGDDLLLAAGIGMDCARHVTQGERVLLRWQAD